MERSGIGSNPGMVNKLGIWLLMITITILFGSLGLGFMMTDGSSADFSLPKIFYINTLILIISSFLLHYGWLNRIKKGKTVMLWPTLGLGLVFLVCQVLAWIQLYSNGLGIKEGGLKISYLYVLTGLHGLHIIGGLLFLLYVTLNYQRKGRKYLETAVFFWHFLGVLWIYLLLLMTIS
ncbi:MAG: cytochrome c oxidase subunit 3 [Bacteroidia bacterium]|nr:cytochrome c oxidase subunit 3 [Bacteroidia bacterium]